MENSEMSNYVNLPFGGEIDEHMVMSGEMDMSMTHYINETERHEGQSLGSLGDDNTIENGNGFAVEALNYIHFDDFVHAPDAMSDGQQMIWNIGAASDNQMAAEGWDPSSLAIHDSVQTTQENTSQTMLMGPDAATQFLIDPALVAQHQPQPPTQTQPPQQGHSYGTRFANQMRPTPGIQPRTRKQRPKKGRGEADDGPYCICRGPTYGVMVECDSCNEWFHCDCVNITPQQAQEVDTYHCPKCQVESPALIGLIKDDRPMAEATGIDPKALLIEEPTDVGQPKSIAKCAFKDCSNPARENNPYCSDGCSLHNQILEIKKTKGPELMQSKSSPPIIIESKKVQRPVLPKLAQSNVSGKVVSPGVKPGIANHRPPTAVGQTLAMNRMSSPQLRKMPIPPRKSSSGSSGDSTTKVRNLCMEKFHSLFTKKYTELQQKGELPDSQEGPEQLAQRLAKRIEESIYDNFASKTERDGLGQSYKSKFRNLLTSLGHPKNEDLLMQVVKGDIPPVRLVMMSAEDLANPEQKSLMVKVRRESMQQSVLKAEDINGPRIKKTHKGEFIIVEVGRDSPKHDTPDTSSMGPSTHSTFNASSVRPKINVEDLIPKRRTSTTDSANSANSENTSRDDSSRGDDTNASINNFSQATIQNDDSRNHTKSSNNIVLGNMETTGSPIAMSVGSSTNSPPLSPQAKTIISPTMSPSNTPPEEPPSNPMQQLTPIWKGRLLYDGVARFSGQATLVAAKKRDKERNWEEILAASIRCNGHVSRVKQADDYLIDCWCSPSKDVAFIKFEANEDDDNDKEQFDLIFNYLRYSPKDRVVRYGRVANAYNTVREMYLIPLEPEDKIPDVITFLDHEEIFVPKNNEKRESKLLLGAIVIIDVVSSKTKRPRDLTQNIARPIKKEKLESSTAITAAAAPTTTTTTASQPNIGNSPLVNKAVVQSPIVAPQTITNTIMAPPVNSPQNQPLPTNLPAVTAAPNGILPGLLQSLLAQSSSTLPNQSAPPTAQFPQPPPQFSGPPPPNQSGPPAPFGIPPPQQQQPQLGIPPQPAQFPTHYPTVTPPSNGPPGHPGQPQFIPPPPPPHNLQGPPAQPGLPQPPPPQVQMPPGFPPQYEQFYQHLPPPTFPQQGPPQQPLVGPPQAPPQPQSQPQPPQSQPPQPPQPQPQSLPPYVPPPTNEYAHFQPPPSDNRRPPGVQDFRPKWGPPPDNRPPWDQGANNNNNTSNNNTNNENRQPTWEWESNNNSNNNRSPMDHVNRHHENRPQWDQDERRNWNQNESRPPREREYRRGPSPPHSDYRDRRHRGHSHNRDLRGRRGNNSPRGGRNLNGVVGQNGDRDWNDHERNDWGDRERDDRDDSRFERNNREHHHYGEISDRGGKSRRGGRFRGTRA